MPGLLVNAPQPPARVVELLTPIAITEPGPGVYGVALERVVAGWEKISVQGPAKKLITIHFGEKLNTNGTVEYQGALFHFPSFIYSYAKFQMS
jgi:alpha-L-rhamnosidase